MENQEKFSRIFLYLDKYGKDFCKSFFNLENLVNKRDKTEEGSKLEEDKTKSIFISFKILTILAHNHCYMINATQGTLCAHSERKYKKPSEN